MTDQSAPAEGREAGDQAVDPAVQARVDELMRALAETPAIECPFTFNWHGNQELADRASLKIRLFGLMMREEFAWMSFESLKGITFHHDYELGLKEVASADRDAPTPTKEAGGLSVGMMVRVRDGVHLVMHESVALALASEVQEQRDWAEHVVRHELCHVDDYGFKRGLLEKHPDQATFAGFATFMAPLAEALWDEFYANLYSTGPWSDPRTFLDLLRDCVPTIRAEIVEAILNYRTARNLEALLALVAPKVRFVAQCFGYAAGSLAAYGTTLEQSAPDENAMLESLGLLRSWQLCVDSLHELDLTRPNWSSALDLCKLFPGCIALFEGFGLYYRPSGDGAHVDIPMTDETNPLLVMMKRLMR